jgi:hypothetical protein
MNTRKVCATCFVVLHINPLAIVGKPECSDPTIKLFRQHFR